MADAVSTIVILDNAYDYVVHLTNISDGTGESLVNKVDKSALAVALPVAGAAAAEAVALDLQQADWNVQGFTSVRLFWDHAADSTMAVFSGNGYKDFRGKGDLQNLNMTSGLKDPKTADSTGDVLLTTAGTVSGNTYDITLWFKKRAV